FSHSPALPLDCLPQFEGEEVILVTLPAAHYELEFSFIEWNSGTNPYAQASGDTFELELALYTMEHALALAQRQPPCTESTALPASMQPDNHHTFELSVPKRRVTDARAQLADPVLHRFAFTT